MMVLQITLSHAEVKERIAWKEKKYCSEPVFKNKSLHICVETYNHIVEANSSLALLKACVPSLGSALKFL